MNAFRHHFALLLLLALLGGCGGGTPAPVAPPDTVVLVYMIGSSLESMEAAYGSANLKEMMAAGSLDHTRVVVQTGGAAKTGTPPTDTKAMQPENVNWKRLQRYVVHPRSLEQVQDLGDESTVDANHNMASSVAFKDFIDWAIETYPARRYLIVLWDHGGGINLGVGPDENTDWALSVADIGMVLQAASAGGRATIEITGFDACLMATAEVAAALARSSRYMVASEDVEPGSGWDYTSFLRYVDGNPSASGAEIGAAIVQGYVTKQRAEKKEDLTLSVVDTRKVADILPPLDELASILKGYATSRAGWYQIAKGRVRTLDWGTEPLQSGSLDLADLRGLVTSVVAQIVANLGPDPDLEAKRDLVLGAIDRSVTTNAALGSNARATGLSVYFPSVLAGYPGKGYAVNTSMGQVPFFAGLYTDGGSGLVQAYFRYFLDHSAELMATVTLTDDPAAPLAARVQNDFEYALAGHEAPSCTIILADRPWTVACFDSFRFPDEVTPLLGGNSWLLDTSPTAGWPALADGAGHAHPVALLPDTYGGKTMGTVNDYLVPVVHQAGPEGLRTTAQGDLTVREVIPANGDAATYRVTGFRPAGDGPGRELPLVDGQVYWVRVYATVEGTTNWFQSDRQLTVSGGGLTLTSVPAGSGRLGYFVTDLTGGVRRSALAPFPPAP